MAIDSKKLNALLKWYSQTIENLIAVLVLNRHGLVIDDDLSIVDENVRFAIPTDMHSKANRPVRRQMSLPYRGTVKKAR